jgi:hypothetical protein
MSQETKDYFLCTCMLACIFQNPFNITNEVEGSPLYYSVTYTESNSGFQCDSFNISSFSACSDGVCLCSTSLPSSCFHLSGVITISLSATNRLGRGLSSSFDISKH